MSETVRASLGVRLKNFLQGKARLVLLAAAVAVKARRTPGQPVVFFNASTRLNGLSLNAGFALLASWALRLAGVPVVHFVCHAGMSRCVLGTDPEHPDVEPPCRACMRQSRMQYLGARVQGFTFQAEEQLAGKIRTANVSGLMQVEHEGIPLGAIVLPALRWRLRLHDLADDEPTRSLYREFILSAWSVGSSFRLLLERIQPQAVLLFNGQFFPEATVRFLARQRGIRTVTHEVGLQPMSAYFTPGEATAYPIDIPASFELNAEQNARLDAYLEKRFQGKFSMAGIQFWPEMTGLDAPFLEKAAKFRRFVPVFTNVIFDTSQPHSNVVFSDMFAWLDLVLEVVREHPETLFVLRAHPDESRPGKAASQSVAGWVERRRAADLPNLLFVPADEFISSYELIQRAHFVMIYNSTIGLESAIMGKPVLCAGKARFTQYPTVFFPESVPAYCRQLLDLLEAEQIQVPAEFRRNARRFLYYQLFRTSLDFGDLLEPFGTRGYVRVRMDALKHLQADRSAVVRTLLDGILRDGDFLLEEQ